MKKDTHPELHEITAHCACGKEFKTRSTASELKVTICSGCHPFFTGAQKFVDTAGRIEKFNKRYEKKADKPQAKVEKAPEPKPAKAPKAPKAAKATKATKPSKK